MLKLELLELNANSERSGVEFKRDDIRSEQLAEEIENLLAGQRSPRDPLLVDIMRDYGYVDARGMGVGRKIVPRVCAESGEHARFEATDDFVRVIMPQSVKEK
jgi:predicted HTH transcriptional regulator